MLNEAEKKLAVKIESSGPVRFGALGLKDLKPKAHEDLWRPTRVKGRIRKPLISLRIILA